MIKIFIVGIITKNQKLPTKFTLQHYEVYEKRAEETEQSRILLSYHFPLVVKEVFPLNKNYGKEKAKDYTVPYRIVCSFTRTSALIYSRHQYK